eukprot:Em0008g561a
MIMLRCSKDALKRHLQGHFLKRDPDISEEKINQAGFMPKRSSPSEQFNYFIMQVVAKSEFQALWRHVTNYTVSNKTKTSKQFDVLNSAIALAREDEKVQHSELGASGGSNRRPDFLCKFISSLRSKISDLLSRLQQIGPKDPQVAYRLSVATLLWQASANCVDVSDIAWHQAQLSPGRGGLGLRSLYHHSSACFIASICQSGIALGENHHLEQSIDDLNHIIGVSEALNLHLEPPEFQVALKWWLGMDTSQNACCAFCPSHALDPLGHHALTCKSGGDLIGTLQSRDQAKVAMIQQVDRKLLFIPIVFILLRIWGTLEFIFTEVYSKYFCTNSPRLFRSPFSS